MTNPLARLKRLPRPSWYWAFVAVFIALASIVYFAQPQVLRTLRAFAFDTYQRLAPAQAPANAAVVVVDIDEASLSRLGQWPWSRATMAELTDRLGEAGAAAIVFDVLFSEPDRTSPEQILAAAPEAQRAALGRVIAGWPTHDSTFAEALARHRSVLAASFQSEPTTDLFPLKAGQAFAGDNPSPFLPAYDGVSTSLPALYEASLGVGFMNWTPDNDQIVRRVPLFARQGDVIAPSLALEALRVAQGASTYLVRSANAQGAAAFGRNTGMSQVRVGAATIPTSANGEIWIHFARFQPGAAIPAWRVIAGDVDPSALSGRIVLIGASASGLMDLRATPLDAAIPGVDIHRQILEQIIAQDFLSRPDFAPAIEWLVALLVILVLAFAAPRTSASLSAGFGLLAVFVVFAIGLLSFVYAGYLFDPIFPAACAFVFSASAATYLYRRTEQQRAQIRLAFSQYVSPDIVHQLTAHPERLKLGGEVRDLTVLVCDIRNFTTISERLNAEELTAFINSFLTPLTDIIIANGGTIDKYMGDAIMAFWNAPLDDAQHARHGCDAALQIVGRMTALNDGWRAQAQAAGRSFEDVAIGIGLNTGQCCVGNLGSDRRFDYSAIGDAVNVSSRLEGLTKAHRLPLLVGELTAQQADGVSFVEVDLVRLKGRATPSRIYAPLEEETARTFDASTHEAFLAAYRQAKWSEANILLEKLSANAPARFAPLYEVYKSRVARLSAMTLETWDGVYELEQK
ncbi:MAG: adenylate/guanylate cyclase domain-containing protein [Hyphomonadaceae bacterium]|nr:adenylate/guanylate cyclase domain-containing protein [Hyphomonadaceae bacterium]